MTQAVAAAALALSSCGTSTVVESPARAPHENATVLPTTTTSTIAATTTTLTVVRPPAARASRSAVRRLVPRAPTVATRGDCGGWRDLVARYPWPVDEACRVLWCESRGDPTARNGRYHSLFQVGNGSFDPETNVMQAFAMWSHRGWQPWTCKP